jgi:hypothetical protein
MQRLREDQDNERDLTRPIDVLARDSLPCSCAPDGAVANQITALSEDALQICGEMWFLGDQAPIKRSNARKPSTASPELYLNHTELLFRILRADEIAFRFRPGSTCAAAAQERLNAGRVENTALADLPDTCVRALVR